MPVNIYMLLHREERKRNIIKIGNRVMQEVAASQSVGERKSLLRHSAGFMKFCAMEKGSRNSG